MSSFAPAARWATLAVMALALCESYTAVRVCGDASVDAWPQLAAAVATRDDADPVFVAQPWLSPLARMYVAAAADLDSVAAPDLHGLGQFHVIGWEASWSPSLERALEGLPKPALVAQQSFGPLVWSSYLQTQGGRVRTKLEQTPMLVETDTGPCSGREHYKCNEGTIEPRIAEIDYQPRRCLGIAVRDGTTLRLRWRKLALGVRLRGHIGMADYNARLRNDAPLRLVVRIDGHEQLRNTVTDMQGWWPFSIDTEPGAADIEIEITVAMSGTFSGTTYDGTPSRLVCVEARTFTELP